MDILFKKQKDRIISNDESKLKQKYKGNPRRSKLIRARLDELTDAENLAVMRFLPQAYCHELKGNRAGQLALKLDQGYRMVFEPADNPVPKKKDGGLDWDRVTAIRILELSEDYHD
ncbi:MAG: killer suppression protein [Desulfobacterales bacterium]|nr:killer suppression protein [Desulfobacterales bacterium]